MSKRKKSDMSKGYSDTVDAVSRAIREWFDVHPGCDPQFRFPPEKVVISGDLWIGLDIWSPNADAQALIKHVDKVTGERATLLQFQVCYQHYQRYGRRPNA